MPDMVNHPPHYTQGPVHDVCGQPVECITVTESMNFNVGNAVKYLWRHGSKGSALQDLEKARWYVSREIDRLKYEQARASEKAPDVPQAIDPLTVQGWAHAFGHPLAYAKVSEDAGGLRVTYVQAYPETRWQRFKLWVKERLATWPT